MSSYHPHHHYGGKESGSERRDPYRTMLPMIKPLHAPPQNKNKTREKNHISNGTVKASQPIQINGVLGRRANGLQNEKLSNSLPPATSGPTTFPQLSLGPKSSTMGESLPQLTNVQGHLVASGIHQTTIGEHIKAHRQPTKL